MLHTYDADGLLASVGDLSFTYDPSSGLPQTAQIGGATDAWSFDGFGELSSYSAAYLGTALLQQDVVRDAIGRIVEKSETIAGVTTIDSFSYDDAGRLTEAHRIGEAVASYTYDANGNRLSHSYDGGTDNGSYDDQDRLLSYGPNSYQYSANGELVAKSAPSGTTGYAYDELANLREVILPNSTVIDYVVDAEGRRVAKEVDGVLVQGFLYQDDLKVVAELDGSGAVVARFVYGNHVNVPEYMIKADATYRFVLDIAGSPRLLIDVATGQVVQRMDYDEFGRVVLDTNPGFQPFWIRRRFVRQRHRTRALSRPGLRRRNRTMVDQRPHWIRRRRRQSLRIRW